MMATPEQGAQRTALSFPRMSALLISLTRITTMARDKCLLATCRALPESASVRGFAHTRAVKIAFARGNGVCKNYSERLNEKGEPGDGGDAKEGANNGEPSVAPDIKVKAVPKVRANKARPHCP